MYINIYKQLGLKIQIEFLRKKKIKNYLTYNF